MHIAILMTNTDESAFAQQHPKDGEKFTDLLHLVRPTWTMSIFAVKDDIFPDDLECFDGVIITGSPASVLDPTPWTARLQSLIRTLYDLKIPMFGACYGRQAIALALGGAVGPNPSGWVFGMTTSQITKAPEWMADLASPFDQYGAHIEAVTKLPDAAEMISVSDACAITGFRISDIVYTTQNHPEMTEEFITALVEEYQHKLPNGVGKIAANSLTHSVARHPYAATIAKFFETRKKH